MANTGNADDFPGPPKIPAATLASVVAIRPGVPDPARTVVSTIKPTSESLAQ